MNEEFIKQAIIFAAVFAAAAVLLLIVRSVVFRFVDKWARKTATTADDIAMHTVRGPSFFWALAIALYVAIGTSNLPAQYVDYGLKALYIIIILSVTVAIANLTSRFVQSYLERSAKDVPVTGLSRGIIKGVILIIGGLIILNGLGVSITPLVTALGVGGLAVALALQETLTNLFAGVYILVERPLRVGDYIKLDSGEEGYVTDIGWRTTRIRKLQNNIVIIPNNKLAQSTITNFHMPEKRMSLLIPVGVSYDCDPENIEEILLDVVKKAAADTDGLLSEPAPFVRFSPGFGDSSLDFTIICQVSEFVNQYYVQHDLRKRIFKRFNEEGIEIPFPQRTVHLKQS